MFKRSEEESGVWLQPGVVSNSAGVACSGLRTPTVCPTENSSLAGDGLPGPLEGLAALLAAAGLTTEVLKFAQGMQGGET